MCGIFGLIRNTKATHPERASAAFVELGKHAVERGFDSAGFALVGPVNNKAPKTTPTVLHANANDTTLDHVRIIKAVGTFHDLWSDSDHLPLLAEHRVAFGHTRWATQGKRDALTNASPLITGNLVGTHNGDVSTYSVPGKSLFPRPLSSTDTEVLYQALNRDRRDRRKITDVLSNVQGRAALAWVDRDKADRVYLARAALSPLSIAWDAEGNLYWASNPRWFRDIDTMFDHSIGFTNITMVAEGTLLTISVAGESPDIEDMRQFTPTCRASDARLSDGIVWRAFSQADTATDKAQVRHRVAPMAPQHTSSLNSPARSSASSSQSNGATSLTHSWWEGSKSASSSLPDYHDRLDEVLDQVYTASSGSATGFDADEDDESEWATIDAENEALDAVEAWVDSGADETVLSVVRAATMPSEIDALMSEFSLTSAESFEFFRDLMASEPSGF
jgi:glutamine---fructose-6-phosphate transaminase (isomerizing)